MVQSFLDRICSKRRLLGSGSLPCETGLSTNYIKEFWINSDINPTTDFIPGPDEVWRCWICDHDYKTSGVLKTHITRTHPVNKVRGSTADKDTRNQMRKNQEELDHVMCEDEEISNVWTSKYLGSRFRSDGDQITDVKVRITYQVWTCWSVPTCRCHYCIF